MMGGRVAEEMIFGHDKVTSGAQSDIEQATRLARTPNLGVDLLRRRLGDVLLPVDLHAEEDLVVVVAAEVRRLVETGLQDARRILDERKDDLEALARGLLE
jgi:cell division protease FtsH